MCEPATIALVGLAISTAATAYSYTEQKSAAKDQRNAARDQYGREQVALDAQAAENRSAAQGAMSERHRQALIERGRIRAAAGESGLYDNGRIEAESYFNEGSDIASITNNESSAQAQVGRNREASRGSMQSGLNQSRGPSLVGAGLQIAGAGVNSAATYRQHNPKKP